MTTIQLYRKHKAGEIGRDRFLYEVRRDKNLPWVTNITSYDDAVKILKNKGVISEAELGVKLKSNSLNEATLKDLTKPLAAKLESMGYEVEYDSSFGFMNISGFKTLPDESILRVSISPSEGELQQKNYGGTSDEFSTVDVRFTYWTPEITKKLFGLYKTKRLVGRNLPDEGGTNIDLGIGMFDIPVEQSIEKIISMIKNAEQKASQKGGSLNEADTNIATDPAVDRVNPYFLKKGVQILLDKEKELTNDSYIKALNKAALMLQKNPHAFDEEMFANAKDVEKADAKLETEEVKKTNHKNKANEMKKVKVKALKEAAIGELKDYLKKKEQINEDSHYKHHVGSEVHTPDGEGKIIEIVGGTFTVEMKDGTHKDFQINTIDHFTQKAQEELPVQKPQPDQTVKDMWANWKGNTFGGMVGDPEHFKKPLDLSKLKEYIAKHKDDKEKMGKLKKAIKELTLIKKKGGSAIPGAIFGNSGEADTFINQLPPSAKSQVQKQNL